MLVADSAERTDAMPTYDYECLSCRHRFEFFHGMSEPGPARCPECAGEVRRAITASAVIDRNKRPASCALDRGGPCQGMESPCHDSRCDP